MSGMTKREWLTAAGASALSIAIAENAGLSRPALAADNFVVSLSGGPWGDFQIDAYIKGTGFEEKNKVAVSYDRAQDNVRAAKTMARCNAPEFTAVEALNQQAVLLAQGGCIQDYDPAIVTNYRDISEGAKEEPRNGLSRFFGAQVIMAIGLVYNTDEVKTAPTSFEMLADPKLKGKIGIPSFGWVGQQFMYAMNAALGGRDDDPSKGLAFIADLVRRNDAVIFENSDGANRAFAQREIVAMPFWNGRTYFMRQQGLPVAIAYPKGWIQTGNGYVITRGTPNLEAANRFVNNTLDGSLQLQMSRKSGYPPSSTKAELPSDLEQIKLPTGADDRRARLDYAQMIAKSAENQERWNKDVIR